jgi:hypothetical protein
MKPCWVGYKQYGMKKKNGRKVPNCVKEITLNSPSSVKKMMEYILRERNSVVTEAEYNGRTVKLSKPMQGDVKKYKVYVKDPSTQNVIKVNFGDKNMEIKRDNPKNKANFRSRHKCDQKKDKTTPGYWSCKMWSNKKVSDIV